MARWRPAFTLIELLVVTAIVAVLLGLLLSAVQQVRGAAARAECQNRLRQLGLAAHSFHGSNGTFPPGCSYLQGASPQPHMTWMARLLPYLEQETLYRQSLEAFAQDRFFLTQPHRPIFGIALPAFSCPVDGRTAAPLECGLLRIGLTSYLGVSGLNFETGDGVLFLDSGVRVGDIRDGTSNTLTVGERPPNPQGNLGWWYAGWGQQKDGTLDSILGVREYNAHIDFPHCRLGPYHFVRGRFSDDCDAFHFWSPHTGGDNFLFADGSTRFLSYPADGVIRALATRAGPETETVPY